MSIPTNLEAFRKTVLTRPLLFAALALVTGIMAGNGSRGWIAAGLLISFFPIAVSQWRLAILCLLCVLAGCLRMDSLQRQSAMSFTSRLNNPDTITSVTGSITRIYTSTAWLETDDNHEKLEIRFPETSSPSIGEHWTFRGMAIPIDPPRTPGAFDRRSWLLSNGIACRFNAFEGSLSGKGHFKSRLLALSEKCRHAVASILSEHGARKDIPTQIMISVLLGDKTSLSNDVMDDFRTSGSLHIFAVSGLHVGLAAAILFFFLYLLPIHPIKAKALSLILLAVYVFITGMPTSAVRAYIMIAFFVLGMCLRRETHPLNTLALAAIVILCVDPRQLFTPGFQLSFLIFGAIVLTAGLENRLRPWWNPDPFIPPRIYSATERFLVRQERNTRLILAVSFACWLVSIPITAVHFGTFNLYSTLANLLMAPFLAPLMGFSILSILMHWLPMASALFNACARVPAAILLSVSQWIAGQPNALMPWTNGASPSEAIVLALPGQAYCIALGNPGILINCGNEYAARQIVTPALRTCGFLPRYLILTQASLPLTGGRQALLQQWPDIQQLDISRMTDTKPVILRHKRSGCFTIYPAHKTFSTGIAADNTPTILWENHGKRLLFIGDAPMSNLLMLPEHSIHADVILIGRNRHDPIDAPEWILRTGARDIVCLGEREPAFDLLPNSVRIHHLTSHNTLIINMNHNSPSVTPWRNNELGHEIFPPSTAGLYSLTTEP